MSSPITVNVDKAHAQLATGDDRESAFGGEVGGLGARRGAIAVSAHGNATTQRRRLGERARSDIGASILRFVPQARSREKKKFKMTRFSESAVAMSRWPGRIALSWEIQ